MKPLIYGYMRVPSDMPDEEARRREADMEAYARAEGFALAMIFHEFEAVQRSALAELLQALQRTEAHNVVVPSLRDLALTDRLQDALVLQIECEANAQVVSLDEL
ncbi:recombinase family protein [Streptomyces sp. ODS05-4]|uniref:recombinase family protein n=1 Tax=Streptomyces sp. ODS05-4 TaxID=2944939 RepID=UPI00210E1C11|nr:recombinase family protein [Streptomyces sp. ODS05-4]